MKKKANKYFNKKVIINGIKFDSKKECDYYFKLKALEKAGEIKDLKLQVPFILIDTFKLNKKTYRKMTYKADFCYYDKHNKLHVVDVKSEITKKDKVYKIKKKLLAWKYGIEIEEV